LALAAIAGATEDSTMLDDTFHQERLRPKAPSAGLRELLQSRHNATDEGSEASGAAFGCVRSPQEQAAAIEFRFQGGNRIWLSYHWLGSWQYNPSEGLLLRFSGDLTYLVLLRGSNLDRPIKGGLINLGAGLQQHRVLWVREMAEEEVREVGDAGPTIGSIQIAEFESNKELKEWLRENVPAFVH
jgi:hypothetical protein